jgi:hypothetical protein
MFQPGAVAKADKNLVHPCILLRQALTRIFKSPIQCSLFVCIAFVFILLFVILVRYNCFSQYKIIIFFIYPAREPEGEDFGPGEVLAPLGFFSMQVHLLSSPFQYYYFRP